MSLPAVVSEADWFGPGEERCTGCSSFTVNIADLSHLQARDTWWRKHDEHEAVAR